MKKQILIVGGVAGGASAAARLRRLDEEAEIILCERGGEISYANCGMPYYIGGTISQRDALLLQTPASLRARFRIDVRIYSEVVAVDRAAKTARIRRIDTGEEYEQSYSTLILSPGATPILPNIPGSQSNRVFTLRNMQECDAIKTQVMCNHIDRVLVVGGGFIGVELMENLTHCGAKVTLVELADQLLTSLDKDMAAYLHEHIREQGVDLRLGCGLEELEEKEDGTLTAHLSGGGTVDTQLVALAIGVKPDSTLASAMGLKLGPKDSIRVDKTMRTSDPDIYAVGDAVTVQDYVTGAETVIPLAGPANRQGRVAASVIAGEDFRYKGTLGTAICKVFEMTAASTGNSERQLQRQQIPYEKVYTHPGSHANYYPGAQQIHIKLLYDPDTGRILGAQAVGREGVDKRIDVIATAMYAKLTVEDLENLELAYAPPYSSAKDPVNLAGFVAANVRRGALKQFYASDLSSLDTEECFLLDVRTNNEFQRGTLAGAHNIPVDELRERLGELPSDKRIMVFCQVGLRGYVACRILTQKGYDAYNLSGGYVSASHFP